MKAIATALKSAGYEIPVVSSKLDKALKKSNKKTKRTKKISKREWKVSDATASPWITWKHPAIGSVSFSVSGFRLGQVVKVGGVYRAEINVTGEPEAIKVLFNSNLAEGVIPQFSKGGQVVDCGDGPIPTLTVPVRWERKGKINIPHTRVRDMDNADLLLRMPDGTFVDLQVAVLSRAGTFYLSIQELASGQIIKLPSDVVDEDVGYKKVAIPGRGTFIVAPLFRDHCYPGADFITGIMPRSGPDFVKKAVADNAFVEADGVDLAEWDPPAFPEATGSFTSAIVLWCNAVIGAKALCADGVECFIPLQSIRDESNEVVMKKGGFPILAPRQSVLLLTQEGPKGRSAIALKALELVE